MKDETWGYTPAAVPDPDVAEASELSEPCGTAVRQDKRIAKTWVPQEIPPSPPVAPTLAEMWQIRSAQKQVKPMGATAMACSRQRPLGKGLP